MKYLVLILLLSFTGSILGQKEAKTSEDKSFCYIDSLNRKIVYNEICFPEEQNGYITVTFKTQFEFTVNQAGIDTLVQLLSKVSEHSKDEKKVKLGSFNANFLAGLTNEKSEKSPLKDEPVMRLVARGVGQQIPVYYHLGDIVILFPEIRYHHLTKSNKRKLIKSPYHKVYIPLRCIDDFINVFK